MKNMTLVEQAVFASLRQKQIGQLIHQPELSAILKIRIQIEHNLSYSQLTDNVRLVIFEPAEVKYGKANDSIPATNTPIMEEGGTATASSDVAPSEASMFQVLNLPANRKKKFKLFLNFFNENPDGIAKEEQKEMVREGKPLEGFNFHDLISNINVENTK